MKGIFIVLEGINGCGKSTQAELLSKYFKSNGKRVKITDEPTDSKIGMKVKKLLTEKYAKKIKKEEWIKLFTLDRNQNIKKNIIPFLKKGIVVIGERYYHSTLAYQLPKSKWKNYIKKFPLPDIIFIMDLPVNKTMKRIKGYYKKRKGKIDFFEKITTLKKARKNYLAMKNLKNVKIINANQSPENILNDLKKELNKRTKRIISLSGPPGSGKNTVGDLLAKKLKMKRYSMGDLRRKMAQNMGLTLGEINKLGEKKSFTDKKVDEYQKKLAEKENNFVVDGRLSFYFIPESIKIYLDVKPKEGAKRIFIDQRKNEKKYCDLKEAINANKERMESDKKRYKKYYKINCYDKKHYDFVVDTTNIPAKQVVEKILKILNSKNLI